MLSHDERVAIRRRLMANEHEIYVFSPEALDEVVCASPRLRHSPVRSSWQKVKKGMEAGASYYASASDFRTLTKLVGDLGGYATRVYVKSYGGKPHIILKGNPRLRSVLTGTKYGVQNAKVIRMGLGYHGAVAAAKAGGVVSVILMTTYRIADYVLTDEATLTSLIGRLATDVVKIGMATGAAIAAAKFVAAGTTMLAVGPLLAIVLVGVVGSLILTNIDDRYRITERLIDALDSFADKVQANGDAIVDGVRQTSVRAREALADSVEQLVRSAADAAVDAAERQVRRLINPYPRMR